MGQKVNPHGLRVGVIKDWDSKWYANKKNRLCKCTGGFVFLPFIVNVFLFTAARTPQPKKKESCFRSSLF